jgi:hypothetical protein
MSSSSSDARLRTLNESRETRADRIVIMHPDGMAVVLKNPQSFSTVHSFEQAQVWRESSGFCNGSSCMLISSVCRGVSMRRFQPGASLGPLSARSGLYCQPYRRQDVGI